MFILTTCCEVHYDARYTVKRVLHSTKPQKWHMNVLDTGSTNFRNTGPVGAGWRAYQVLFMYQDAQTLPKNILHPAGEQTL